MTMKKRFLGLALAAMVAVPATTAYANSTTIQGDSTQTLDHNVTVSGTVNTKTGSAPTGKIQVELPTAMSFVVDEESNLRGADYTVKNQSSEAITLSVADFRKTKDGGITVEDTDSFQPESQDRSHVFLSLDGRVDNNLTFVDLGSFLKDGNAAEEAVLDVNAGSSAIMSLTGEAGTGASSDSSNGADAKGATGEFSLVFKIKKKA